MSRSASIVVPIYKNERSILLLVQQFEDVTERALIHGYTLNFVFVVDGSPDQSEQLLTSERVRLKREKTWQIVRLSRNFGQIPAIMAGLKISNANDPTIVISADLQDPPELIHQLTREYENGNDLVVLHRITRSDGFFVKLTSKVAYSILRIENSNIPIGGFDYFLISGRAKKELLKLKGRFRFFQGDVLSLGYPTKFLEYHRRPRDHGKSSYTFKKRLQVFIDAFIDSSYIPIKFATRLGVLISLTGFLVSIFSLVSYVYEDSPFSGFTAIFCSILIIGGFQLMLMGLISEYLYRTYDSSRARPLYIVEKII